MTSEKEIGYEVLRPVWDKLKGHRELWNRTSSDIKDEIVEDTGRKAIELTKEYWQKGMYSEEEVEELCKKAIGLYRYEHDKNLYQNKEHFGKWFEQNKKEIKGSKF